MDLLIQKDETSTRLSSLGFYNITIEDSSPSVEHERRTVKGRSGYIFDRSTFMQKKIEVTARVNFSSIEAKMRMQDQLNGLFMTTKPFYIRKMYPVNNSLYDYEAPGATTGDINPQAVEHREWDYRYYVAIDDEIEFDFIGNSTAGIKYDVSFSFITATLPFGEEEMETVELTVARTDYLYRLIYPGTAPCSQNIVPFSVKFTPKNVGKRFTLRVGEETLTYSHSANWAVGDVFEITAYGVFLNDVNVSDRTNNVYFTVYPSTSKTFQTGATVLGTIEFSNLKALYY